jgi:hypothetical protein
MQRAKALSEDEVERLKTEMAFQIGITCLPMKATRSNTRLGIGGDCQTVGLLHWIIPRRRWIDDNAHPQARVDRLEPENALETA